ncbi:long-chain fatty acid--CoA ligase [Rurimicrobium arvi]|uniref:Long-chain fatty acid--CoA ligase n=1 Tax=Rurimicrobium arvi TaxID=2049916 RepID=A0ABP8MIJ7_9BACT
MKQAGRLFDCISVQADRPLPDLLNAKSSGQWQAYTTEAVHRKVYELAAALLRMGIGGGGGNVEQRDKIAIISPGRPEWIITDLAVQLTGAILVPLYPNTGEREIAQILSETEAKCVFTGDCALTDVILSIKGQTPSVQSVFCFNDDSKGTFWETLLQDISPIERNRINQIAAGIHTDDICTIIYTSGTMGSPKGVMLSHGNIMSNITSAFPVLDQIPRPQNRALSFLPLNHIFEKMVMYIYLFNGFSVYFAENMESIGANMRETGPNVFTAVPRLLEKVFERILAEGQKLRGIKAKIFNWSVHLASKYEISGNSPWYKFQQYFADRLVYSKWRKAVGGNIQAIVVGSSACPVRLERIFTAAGIVIMEGYGLTETSPVIAVNHYFSSGRKFGTVGQLLDDVQVTIADDGEILCKGPNVFKGYYRNEELTREVMQDSWFHTGDIGSRDEQGFLRITDRKKEIFKTSGGKYVAPMPIENRMKESLYIEQMMVLGAGKKFVAALIVPAFGQLGKWCSDRNLPCSTPAEMVHQPEVVAMIQSVIDHYNREFNHVEQVKKFVLLPTEWTIESGELTPTSKMKRRIILDKYAKEIDSIYESDGTVPEL